MKELNIKVELIKISEKKQHTHRRNLHDLAFPGDYLDMTPNHSKRKKKR